MKIKCIQTNTGKESIVDFEDIIRFNLIHYNYENGLKVTFEVKEELINKWNDSHTKVIKENKYEFPHFTIRGKDDNKLRKKFYDLLKKYGKTTGRFIRTSLYNGYTHNWLTLNKIEMESYLNGI